MFSQACVKNSVHGGGGLCPSMHHISHDQGDLCAGGLAVQGGLCPGGSVWGLYLVGFCPGVSVQGVC